jgi:hypothetical protein
VQLALETISMFVLYVFSFTPTTNIGASADGADITTFLAPPCRSKSRNTDLRCVVSDFQPKETYGGREREREREREIIQQN